MEEVCIYYIKVTVLSSSIFCGGVAIVLIMNMGVDQGGCLSNIKRCWFVRPILLWVNLFSMNFKLSRGDCIIEVWINLILLQDWVQLLFSSDQGSFL